MLKIYNTLSRKKEIFKPRRGRKVNLFVCGPTVYDYAHLGHARTYIAFDMIVKYLKEKRYGVFYLQNITDLDDKIINRAKEKGVAPQTLTRDLEKEYLKDMKVLKVNSVTKYARATDYIKEIISQTKRLLEKGYAYQIDDGIYYDISKFKNYGKLSGRTVQRAEDAVSRIDENINKKNKGDFVLWKISKPGEPKWPSPWGEGRPGWHIEDTAITEKFFGPQYDIHGGAQDLIFPHHEAEIAQMESASGKKPLVRYWLHTGFLMVGGQKMSKSLGNFITIRDFLKKHSPRILRFLMLKNHYRSPMDYTDSAILQAERELEKIDAFINKIQKSKFKISKFKNNLELVMDDDFNTPKAMAVIFRLIKSGKPTKEALLFLKQIDKFFNFIFWPKVKERLPLELLRLAEQRQKYRREGDWREADRIRDEIRKMSWLIEDTENGPKFKRL